MNVMQTVYNTGSSGFQEWKCTFFFAVSRPISFRPFWA